MHKRGRQMHSAELLNSAIATDMPRKVLQKRLKITRLRESLQHQFFLCKSALPHRRSTQLQKRPMASSDNRTVCKCSDRTSANLRRGVSDGAFIMVEIRKDMAVARVPPHNFAQMTRFSLCATQNFARSCCHTFSDWITSCKLSESARKLERQTSPNTGHSL